MKMISLLTSEVLLAAAFFCKANAQNMEIDFSSLVQGNFYEVTLINGMVYTGKFTNLTPTLIELQTEDKLVRIKKEYIETIEKSRPVLFKSGFSDIQIKQDSGLKKVILKDGSEFIGRLIYTDTIKLILKTLSGAEVIVRKDQFEEITDERSDYGKDDDPNKSRLFFAPTGRNLKSGTGYFSVNELLFPVAAFGITDYVTLAGGISIVPGISDQLFYLNSKIGVYQSEELNFSAGILYMDITSDNGKGLAVIYGNGTYGGSDASVTISAGISMSSDNDKYPIMILGGELKVSSSIKLITENWIQTSPHSMSCYSFGLRFFGKKLAGDFGLVLPVDNGGETISGWPFIPWLGFNYSFGM